VTAIKTTSDGMAAAESSRILRVVASVPPWAFRRRREFASRFSSRGIVAGRRDVCRPAREGCSRRGNLL